MLSIFFTVSSFSALLDACVLFPYSLSNTLLNAAHKGLYRIHFSTKILDEAIRSRVKKGKMDQVSADELRQAWLDAFPDALVETPTDLEDKMENHSKDRHVLASAVYAKVDVIVTSNVRDFPESSLSPWNMEVMHPDDFLNYLSDQNGDEVMHDLLTEQINSYKKPPRTYLDFFSKFELGQPNFSNRMLNYAYNCEVEEFARNVLMTVNAPQEGARCLNGNRYKICETNNGIVITEKSTKREVFRSYDDNIRGNLKVVDIEIFDKVNKEEEVYKIPFKVKNLSILKNKAVES